MSKPHFGVPAGGNFSTQSKKHTNETLMQATLRRQHTNGVHSGATRNARYINGLHR